MIKKSPAIQFSTALLCSLFSFAGLAQKNHSDEGTILRILSFNVLHGATTEGNYDLDVVARVINEAEPDLVALQELDYKTKRAGGLDIATELAIRTSRIPVFASAMNYNGGQFGVGLLSKYPFQATSNNPLPTKAGNEPRTLVAATLKLPSGHRIRIYGTHLDYHGENKERMSQVRTINKMIRESDLPTILAGDLNDTPGSPPIELLQSKWGAVYESTQPAPTFPSSAPKKKIDYVMYYPKDRWKVKGSRVICDEVASDHCAYLVVLELLPDNN